MRDERLAARGRALYRLEPRAARPRHNGATIEGDPRTAKGRAEIVAFFASLPFAEELRGPLSSHLSAGPA